MMNDYLKTFCAIYFHNKAASTLLAAMLFLAGFFSLLLLVSHPVQADETKTIFQNELSGTFMLDGAQTGPFYDKQDQQQSQFEVRQGKLAMKSKLGKTWKTKLQLQYDSDIADKDTINSNDIINDAYVDYKVSKDLKVRLGKMKETSGFERQTSSANLSTMERSMVSSTFLSGRNAGLQVYDYGQKKGWAIGYFDESLLAKDNMQSLHARYYQTFDFENAVFEQWQLGINGAYRNLNDELIQFKSSGETHTGDNIIRSGRFYANNSFTTQLELTALDPNWLLHTSYINTQIRQTGESGETMHYHGGFIQIAYSTGGLYKLAKGKQGYLKQGWELVSRISAMDLTHTSQGIETGNQASIILLGANYYDQHGFKYMANLLLPSIAGQVNSLDQSGSAFSLRAQYRF